MFETKGDTAEWRLIYNHALTLNIGATITYDDFERILGRDLRDSRTPVYDAMRHLEKDAHRTLTAVTNTGYRIAEPSEHEGLAKHHHRKSKRQLRRAVSKASSADRSALSPEERKRIDNVEMALRQHSDMIQRLDTRTREQAKALKELRRATNEDVAEVSEKVDRLESLLQRHGINADVA